MAKWQKSVIPTLLAIAIEKLVKAMQYFQLFANSNWKWQNVFIKAMFTFFLTNFNMTC
jgi:hypothetical protein